MKTSRKVVIYLVAWLAAGLVSTSQTLLVYQTTSGTVEVRAVLVVGMPYWIAWAVLGPIVLWAGRRFAVDREHAIRSISLHAVLFFGMWTAVIQSSLWMRSWLGLPSQRGLIPEMLSSLHLTLVLYIFILLVARLQVYLREGRERELSDARMRERLSEARLDALRAQLHPHFLFNTMHAIAAQIRSTPGTAEDMLADLAELLRHSVDETVGHEVSLEEELSFIDRYLAIQRARFGERLVVETDVPGELHGRRVPSLILQPLVENAIEHGIVELRSGGRLRIQARKSGDSIVIVVENDGTSVRAEDLSPEKWRLGLANTGARLETMYGDRQRFEIASREEGGVRVTVTLPDSSAVGRTGEPT